MDAGPYLDRILDDESLAGDLDEADAAALVKAVVARAEAALKSAKTEEDADAIVSRLRAAGRQINKTVAAWNDSGRAAAADAAKKYGLPAPPASAKTTAEVLSFFLQRLN